MAEYFAKPALWGYEPYEKAGVCLTPLPEDEQWLILRPLTGAAWPNLGQIIPYQEGRLAWFGPGKAMLFGAQPLDAAMMYSSRQTGAWVGISVSGEHSLAALARILPLDLRLRAFAPQSVALTLAGQISVLVIRESEDQFALYTPRSMVLGLWNDLRAVLAPLAARQAL